MAKFSMIDSTKPLRLLAYTRCAQVDPEFEELAISLRMPALRHVDAPTADAEPLSIEETGDFIAWLMTSGWGGRLEKDLQCMSQDAEGRPLLTSWLKASEFEELVEGWPGFVRKTPVRALTSCFETEYVPLEASNGWPVARTCDL